VVGTIEDLERHAIGDVTGRVADVEAEQREHAGDQGQQPGAVGCGDGAFEQAVVAVAPVDRELPSGKKRAVALEDLAPVRLESGADDTELEQAVGPPVQPPVRRRDTR
jgi:hypothetical protein